MRRGGVRRAFGPWRWLLAVAVLLAAAGCAKGAGGAGPAASPTQKQVQQVAAQGAAIAKTQDPQAQRQQLAKLAARAQAFNQKKGAAKAVKAAYRKALAAGKKAVSASEKRLLTASRAKAAKEETEKTIGEKLTRLAGLAKTVSADAGLVYPKAARAALLKDIAAQTKQLQATRTQVILAVDDPQRYLDAYQTYVVEGKERDQETNLSGDWGDPQTTPDVLAAVGLTKDKFTRIFGGLHEYYGRAVGHGFVSYEQALPAVEKAIDKLYAGDYADQPVKITQMNFYLIKKGDFAGLVGQWRPVALYAVRATGTAGYSWDNDVENIKPLSATKYHISDGTVTLRGQNQKPVMVGTDGSAAAEIDESVEGELSYSGDLAGTTYIITFMTKGADPEDMPNLNRQKEHIVIYTNKPRSAVVYERQ
ncbi:hypothetical protein ACFQ3L_08390 [Lacticaseibacillus jixianensis]|uniref:Lipoprotein n=1 Tax=Lacticaseibacillus jixianensis TaxID=2486012 RepID=A0ABW4B9Y2_9LACO|nr:hypothetical protein [Lacticaseibacillus jixianensis]